MNLKEYFKKLLYWLQLSINKQKLPIRIAILLGVLVGIYLLWLFIVYLPTYQREHFYQRELSSLGQDLESTNTELDTIIKKLSGSDYQLEQNKLNQEAQAAEKYLMVLHNEVIPADKMSKVLRDVLLKEQGLELKDFHIFPRQTLVTSKPVNGQKAQVLLYEQNVQMSFSGNYFAVVKYLQHLENLSWRFFWDEISYDVTQYPKANVMIKLHTLGLGNNTDQAIAKVSNNEQD